MDSKAECNHLNLAHAARKKIKALSVNISRTVADMVKVTISD